jgi:DedD protein
MPLPSPPQRSFFNLSRLFGGGRSGPAASAPRAPEPGRDPDAVEAARIRARRRLIGAVVLLVAGLVTFPLVFETEPRPIAVDTPIEVARGAGAALPVVPAARPAPRPAQSEPPPPDAGTETAPAAGMPPLAPSVAAPASAAVAAPPPRPAAAPVVPAPAPVVAAAAPAVRTPAADASPAARPPTAAPEAAASGPGRFVVQVGAFTEAKALRDARARVERLGFKTYTQVIDSDAGKRTRVRVGPFATRAEADSASAKLRAAGLPANILTL